jgi:ribosomal-protein-alanine N-acetyltransferase
MGREHIPAIAALERACFSSPWSERTLEDVLYDDSACFIVAEGEDGSLLGYAGVHVVLDEGYMDNVAVREDCRRQGVAGALVDTLVRFGQAHLAFLTLEVRISNRPALDLYMKHGFEQVGRRRGYYEKPKEDAILMTLEFERGT